MDEPNTTSKPWTNVSFRVTGPSLNPELVTERLGLVPDHQHKMGELRDSNPKFTAYKHGMWAINSSVSEDEHLETHIRQLLDVLLPHQSHIRELGTDNTVDFHCGVFEVTGFELSIDVIEGVALLGARIEVSIYY